MFCYKLPTHHDHQTPKPEPRTEAVGGAERRPEARRRKRRLERKMNTQISTNDGAQSGASLPPRTGSVARVQIIGPAEMSLTFPLMHKRAINLMNFAVGCAEEYEATQRQWCYEI